MGALQADLSYFPCMPAEEGIGSSFCEIIPIYIGIGVTFQPQVAYISC